MAARDEALSVCSLDPLTVRDSVLTRSWCAHPSLFSHAGFTETRQFVDVGTSEATFTVEDGFLIIANRDGEKASLRLEKRFNPNSPIVAVDPKYCKVTLSKKIPPSA